MSVTARHLVGREDEVAAIVGLLSAPDRLPGVVVLAGEAGIGKTTLWLAGLDAAAGRGYRILSCRPSEAETGSSFMGLSDLLGNAAGDLLPGLPPIQRRALEAALLIGEPGVPADERAVAAAFLGALRLLAADGPIWLAVDDVQWLDIASLAALRYALARLDAEPVAALLTVRGDPPAWLRRAVPEQRLRTVEVRGLSVGAIRELLRARLDATFPRPTLLRLWETSRGNPFFALELARALEQRGARIDPGGELPVPATLEGLVYERLESLTPEAAEVCRVVSALSEPAIRLVELAVEQRGPGIEEALRARVLELDGERIRFSHPLLASAMAARAAASAKRGLHQRLAALVSDPEQRARHLALAASGPDPQVAAALDEASRRARTRGAVTAAAGLAEQALGLTPLSHVDAIRRRAVIAADLAFHAGDPARAAGFLEDALPDAPTGSHRAEILRHLALVRTETDGPREAVALYRAALQETGDDTRLEALIHVELADVMRFSTGLRSSEPHAAAAVAAAERSDDRELLHRALSVFGLVRFSLGHGVDEDVIARAVALEEELGMPLRDRLGGRESLCDQRFWSNDLEAARALAQELREDGHRRDGYDDSEGLFYLALIEWRVGNWERAAELAAEASGVEEQLGREALAPVIGLPTAVIAAHRGFVDEARELARAALARAQEAGIGTSAAHYRWVLGFLELSLGRPEAALPHLRAARELREAVGYGEPGLMQELPDLLDALVAVGELSEADAVAAPWEERARSLDRAWALAICARVRAVVRAARGDLEGALVVFDEALTEHARTQDPFQHARTLLALGRTQRRAKRRGSARTTIEEALAVFERLGAPLWAKQARAELARIGGRARSRGELTGTEQRIAGLVAEGRTNREVAAALFLTEHSVETALTRVYRKLGVRSRAQLTRLLAAKS